MPVLERVRPSETDVQALLDAHFALMRSQSPPESCHVLPAGELDADDIHLYALRENGAAVAIGALRIEGLAGELKSMHTLSAARGRGWGRRLLRGLMSEARDAGLTHLQLETGSGPEHEAARALYVSEGFVECEPFGTYVEDPLSLFMARVL